MYCGTALISFMSVSNTIHLYFFPHKFIQHKHFIRVRIARQRDVLIVVTAFLSVIIKLQKWKILHSPQFPYFKTTIHRAVHKNPHFRKAMKFSGYKIYLDNNILILLHEFLSVATKSASR
jgi:hypothetical protein